MIKKIIFLFLLINFQTIAEENNSKYDYIKDKAFQQIIIENNDNKFDYKILSDIDGFGKSIGFLQNFFSKKGNFDFSSTYEIYREDKKISETDNTVYFKIGESKFIGHQGDLSTFEIIESKTLFQKNDLIIPKSIKNLSFENINSKELEEKIYISYVLGKNEGSFFDTVLFKQINNLNIGDKLNIYKEPNKVEDYELPAKKIGELIITDFQNGYAIGFISKTNDFITLKDYVK